MPQAEHEHDFALWSLKNCDQCGKAHVNGHPDYRCMCPDSVALRDSAAQGQQERLNIYWPYTIDGMPMHVFVRGNGEPSIRSRDCPFPSVFQEVVHSADGPAPVVGYFIARAPGPLTEVYTPKSEPLPTC